LTYAPYPADALLLDTVCEEEDVMDADGQK